MEYKGTFKNENICMALVLQENIDSKKSREKMWNLPSMCVLCRSESETIEHMFTECTFSTNLYEAVARTMDLTTRNWEVIIKEIEAPNWIVSTRGD